MIQYEIAQKYSRALFSLAKDDDDVVGYSEVLAEIWEVVNENEDLYNALFHPRIRPEDKKEILRKIFTGEIPENIFNFLNLLVDKRREYFLESIIREFNRMVNEEENILEVEVVSAISLKEDFKNRLKKRLQEMMDYQIILKASKDPDIIGGLVLKIGDYIIDGSIKNKLDSLEEQIGKIPVSELGV